MRPTTAVGSVRQRLRDWRTPPTATYSVTPFGLDKKHPNLKACETCALSESRRCRVFDQIARNQCALLLFECAWPARGKLRRGVSNRNSLRVRGAPLLSLRDIFPRGGRIAVAWLGRLGLRVNWRLWCSDRPRLTQHIFRRNGQIGRAHV